MSIAKKIIYNTVSKYLKHLSDRNVDDIIYMKQGKDSSVLILTQPFHAYGITVPSGYKWNGASSPPGPARMVIPKFHKMIKTSCRHDRACELAKNKFDRLMADIVFFLMAHEVEGMKLWRAVSGLAGVRIGAHLGIGNKY
ncbi:DUF1353 domain-containing protein [Desulforhopalus singaporensis]|uniref:Uncharacterized protein n=1 Tax=Desulforhopalus singaporensis TaxID=91360 RepID=A0A1H0NTX4_9BACT|nr:DUF1353 domain-containing protein [Desulforhopalus singaporensis]SDO96114.1 Protein of unknown function [Desulforhopalus singaporensis]